MLFIRRANRCLRIQLPLMGEFVPAVRQTNGIARCITLFIWLTACTRLQRFRFGSQDTDIEGRKYRVSVHDKNRERHRSLLSKLKAHAEHANLPSWRKLLFPLVPRPALPDDEQLIELAQEVFPLRMEVSVHVCDIGRTTSSHYVTTLGDVEACKSQDQTGLFRYTHRRGQAGKRSRMMS